MIKPWHLQSVLAQRWEACERITAVGGNSYHPRRGRSGRVQREQQRHVAYVSQARSRSCAQDILARCVTGLLDLPVEEPSGDTHRVYRTAGERRPGLAAISIPAEEHVRARRRCPNSDRPRDDWPQLGEGGIVWNRLFRAAGQLERGDILFLFAQSVDFGERLLS